MNIWYFEPLPDITPYEVSVCLANFTSYAPPKNGVDFRDIDPPDLVRRHFRRKEADDILREHGEKTRQSFGSMIRAWATRQRNNP